MLRDSHAVAHTHASLLGRACALPGGRGFEVGRCGRLVGRLTVQCSLSMLVGRLRDGRVTVLFADMVAGRRGASRRRQPDGRRSRFDPCMLGWFCVGRLACGLFTVQWRLQLRCGWCPVVLASSWSAWSAWVSSRRCRWLYIAECCLCGRHVCVGAGQLRLGWSKGGVVRFVSAGWPRP